MLVTALPFGCGILRSESSTSSTHCSSRCDTLFPDSHSLLFSCIFNGENLQNQIGVDTQSLEEKMAEIRIVSRAKLLLISEMQMDEAQAHRYIEKQAMDRCVTKRAIAEEIINTYSRQAVSLYTLARLYAALLLSQISQNPHRISAYISSEDSRTRRFG